MSNMAKILQLTETSTQLPVDWYLNPEILELEKRFLFDQGPGYIGHEVMLPNVGDYYVPESMGGAKVLVRNECGIELLSNICRHRQSVLLKGRGNAKNIVCPIHRWTYAMNGQLLGAPYFKENPCTDLGKTSLQNWNGLLFTGRRRVAHDMAKLSMQKDFDFSGHVLDRIQVEEYACNWKTFIEVYLEDYHVDSYHPGLSNFVNTDALEWEFNDYYSVQTVGVNNARLQRAGTPVYAKWQEQVLRQNSGKMPPYGAIWLLYYPNIMLEWYPHTLIISTLLPTGVERCTNVVEFYYPEDIALFEREFVEAEQAAYQETAIEDNEICRLITAGRRALYEQNMNEAGPYQPSLEAGMIDFHQFLQREIRPHID
ncbi:Phenylpropionate dioxygenase, large terminal subunit [Nitrosomonas cryotolerans]|uniref:Phenylpropionate dioxygenase, large terminal subunit n=1 Tax=Nitrosomonas cryotolerans ATCC 49181 TaxID=1131553 RepID=A0A1N6J055_9PROT|nr:aromatic ring-hydroxylating dioxygenase subunit alpha [Nitrosomonas cryotolerans]SFP54411.1 Phenylpropionate dioxygenase, large terminal subunit [Nitrosomonas cryotolerans]SIO37569.1 Phenylpropionate dioxygenase, large terminal subunit [Nitrosomonas cryotolerans ATCC 49181]